MDLEPTPQVKPLAKYVSQVDVPIKSSHPCPAKKSNHIIKSVNSLKTDWTVVRTYAIKKYGHTLMITSIS